MKNVLVMISLFLFSVGSLYAQMDTTRKGTTCIHPSVTEKDSSLKNPACLKDTIEQLSSCNATDSSRCILVYVYRPKKFAGSVIFYKIRMNQPGTPEMILGEITNGSKFAAKIYKEGPTEIFAKTEVKTSLPLDLKFGQVYYIKCGISMGVFVGHATLNVMDPNQGKMEYDKIK